MKVLNLNSAIKLTMAMLIVGVLIVVGFYFWSGTGDSGASALDQEIEKIEQLLRDNPANAEAWIALGGIRIKQKKMDEAISAYNKALAINSNHAGAYFGLGLAYMNKGDSEAAIANLDRAVKISESSNFAGVATSLDVLHYYLGKIYLGRGDLDLAYEELTESLAYNRVSADAIFLIGKVQEARGNYTAAEESYLRALRLVPNYAEVYSQLGSFYTQQNEHFKADYNLAMASLFIGNVAEAVGELEAILPELSPNADAYWALGWGYEKLNQRDKAIAAYKQATGIDPSHVLARGALSRLGAAS